MLGGEEADGHGCAARAGRTRAMDGALDAVYGERSGGSGAGRRRPWRAGSGSCASTSRVGWCGWCSRMRSTGSGCTGCCSSPRCWTTVTPDVHLAATLMSLRDALPEASRQVGAAGRARRWCRTSSAGSRTGRGRRARRAGPQRADEPAAARRDRLGPHDQGQPQALPARAQDGHPGAARRPRAQEALARRRADPRARSERLDGQLGRPRRRARGVARVAADAGHEGDRLRHLGRRPHRGARRPGRRAVRHPARRRDRHRPGARLLPELVEHARRRPC